MSSAGPGRGSERGAPVFHDPSGKRARLFQRALAAIAAVLALVTSVFVASLLAVPLLPRLPALSSLRHQIAPVRISVQDRRSRLNRYLLRQSREKLWQEMAAHRARRPARVPAPAAQAARAGAGARGLAPLAVRGAFYGPWQETGLGALRANADRLTHLFPEWLRLDPSGLAIDERDFDAARVPHNRDVLGIAREHQLPIHPMLTNAEGGEFEPTRAHRLLTAPESQKKKLAIHLRRFLAEHHFQGLNLDLENLRAEDYPRLPAFVDLLARTLHCEPSCVAPEPGNLADEVAGRLALSVDVEADEQKVPLEALAKSADFVVLMAYDEHYAGGKPGPIAPLPWFTRALDRVIGRVPAEKLVIGLGNYAYDWRKDGGPAESLTFEQAVIRARAYHPDEPPTDVIRFDPEALNATFEYTDDDDGGREHVVWMLDAVSAYDQWQVTAARRPAGAALWVLGSEDPALWTFFDRARTATAAEAGEGAGAPEALATIPNPSEIEYDGKGEILSLRATPSPGRRRLDLDASTGLVTDLAYESFPTSYVLHRGGHRADTVALTFDDGPDPRYTPQILDVLKANHVRATFFTIGEQVERYPEIVRRIFAEGHEIGSHTFTHPNLAAVTRERQTLELNATQRALEAALGRSTILFRPPYNADIEPQSAEEVAPLITAAELGYVVVGQLIDPQDWKLTGTSTDGTVLSRTAADITREVLAGVDEEQGNVVLFHDGGGDRSRTVEALSAILPALAQKGKKLATASALLGRTRDEVMPPVADREALLVGFDRVFFDGLYVVETFLGVSFFTAIILGIGRVLMMIPLALVGRARERAAAAAAPAGGGGRRPTVTVLIAAYNEEPVIARTIESILASDDPVLEIIVVDDGSKDDTRGAVERAFGGDARVHLVHQENAGKAAALNNGIARAEGEVLVCLDADTQLARDAIGRMASHFADPKVGAVAGNVKVGNRLNVFTKWQAIEYITSQNLDRRANAVLNAVTVVPGAVGAWRKQAVVDAGGYLTDTLAEDMDLTFRLRRAGWRIETDTEALGYTEAPDTLKAFFKQRFRWSYGTLQCLVKHRSALLRHGWFGAFALPTMWIFNFGFQLLGPLVDLQLLYALGHFLVVWITQGLLRQDWQPLPGASQLLLQTAFFYALFFLVELAGAILAFWMDRERLRLLVWLFWQRFGYRQIMYVVGWKAVLRAIAGMRQGWGKLERKGTVAMPPGAS